jgi:regulation of enolase protein 1 (concanavalin A-like superfamily)
MTRTPTRTATRTGTPAATATRTPTPPAPTATRTPTRTPTSGVGLPSPWVDQDIGAVGLGGSASYSAATFTDKASGADIWGTADAFHYVYRPMSGDTTIVARVSFLQNTDPWAKGGIMIRESLAAGAKNAFIGLTPGNGLRFQRRLSTGGTSVVTAGGAASAPYWVKLVRAGNTLTAYKSTNGTSWVVVGSDTVSMTSGVYVGLAVSSHNNTLRCTSTFTNVSVTTP